MINHPEASRDAGEDVGDAKSGRFLEENDLFNSTVGFMIFGGFKQTKMDQNEPKSPHFTKNLEEKPTWVHTWLARNKNIQKQKKETKDRQKQTNNIKQPLVDLKKKESP